MYQRMYFGLIPEERRCGGRPMTAASPGATLSGQGLEQVELTAARDRVEATLRLEFAQDAVDMPLDSPEGDDELVRYFLVGVPRRQQPQDLEFTLGEGLREPVDCGVWGQRFRMDW